jgi:hypothetical protein
MFIVDCEQRTDEWYRHRIGIPTASSFSRIITSRGARSDQRTGLMYELAGERLSGVSVESYCSSSMSRGIMLEPKAIEFLEFYLDEDIRRVGLCLEDGRRWGCSPDGLIGDLGGTEIKSPEAKAHIAYHKHYERTGKMPSDHVQQVQGGLMITEREWWIFMSYHPHIKPLIIKVYRDEEYIAKMRYELECFDRELVDLVKSLS